MRRTTTTRPQTVQITRARRRRRSSPGPTPADIVYGTALSATQLNATADVVGSFDYTPAAGVQLNAGANQTLSVSFTPTDAANYNGASKTVQITVLKATPVITWAAPADITYPTVLECDAAERHCGLGSFVYTPAAGVDAERRC